MIFSIFRGLCNHQHNVSLEYFHNPRKKPWTPRNHILFPSLQPLATTNLLFVSMDLPILDIP